MWLILEPVPLSIVRPRLLKVQAELVEEAAWRGGRSQLCGAGALGPTCALGQALW